MRNSEPTPTQQRILDAAASLFSKLGYKNVATRDIARTAEVNETSIYRYYPSKRELFLATLEAGFSKVRLRDEQMARLETAPDSHAAMSALFEIILEAVLQHRELIRLVQFSVLEFGEDLDDLYRRLVRQTLDDASGYLARWPELIGKQWFDTRTTILGFFSILVALNDFYPILAGERLSTESLEKVARTCAGLWHAALAGKPAITALPTALPNADIVPAGMSRN